MNKNTNYETNSIAYKSDVISNANNHEYVCDVYQLSRAFIKDYPEAKYPELMHKLGRPYSCLLVDTHADYLICIPFRSNINHNNSFMFRGKMRSMQTKSGLDYSKIVLINNDIYIGNNQVIIDQDEYSEVQKNINKIVKEAVTYVDNYINHVTKKRIMHPKKFERLYRFSTLPYFHNIMKI